MEFASISSPARTSCFGRLAAEDKSSEAGATSGPLEVATSATTMLDRCESERRVDLFGWPAKSADFYYFRSHCPQQLLQLKSRRSGQTIQSAAFRRCREPPARRATCRRHLFRRKTFRWHGPLFGRDPPVACWRSEADDVQQVIGGGSSSL